MFAEVSRTLRAVSTRRENNERTNPVPGEFPGGEVSSVGLEFI
jgi:hypothetical protein